MNGFSRPPSQTPRGISAFRRSIIIGSGACAFLLLLAVKASALPRLEDRIESFLSDGDGHGALTLISSKQAAGLGRKQLLKCRYQANAMVGKTGKAIEDLSELCQIEPLDTDLLMKRAALYRSIKQYKLAVKDLTRAEEILRKSGRSNGWVLYQRALVHQDTNSESAAFNDLIRASAIEESRFEATQALTQLAQTKGRLSLALDYANKLVKLAPDDESAYIGRARIYIRMRKKTLALKDLAMAMRLSPGDLKEFDRIRLEIERLEEPKGK